jgi:hypothetical protein
MVYGYFGYSFGFSFFLLVAFFLLQWLNIPAGNLVDWLIGIASFWWLLAIVTIPWNVYFDAQEVIAEANISRQQKISFDEKQLTYVKQVARWSILIVFALHILSALGLYFLAVSGISAVGYVSAGATLLLTLLRPAIRGYQYLAGRLKAIRQNINYPREDVLELRQRVLMMENRLKHLEKMLDANSENSLVKKQEEEWLEARGNYNKLRANLEHWQAVNQKEHENISKDTRKVIAQLTEDSQFLEQVRDIIRFFKKS